MHHLAQWPLRSVLLSQSVCTGRSVSSVSMQVTRNMQRAVAEPSKLARNLEKSSFGDSVV